MQREVPEASLVCTPPEKALRDQMLTLAQLAGTELRIRNPADGWHSDSGRVFLSRGALTEMAATCADAGDSGIILNRLHDAIVVLSAGQQRLQAPPGQLATLVLPDDEKEVLSLLYQPSFPGTILEVRPLCVGARSDIVAVLLAQSLRARRQGATDEAPVCLIDLSGTGCNLTNWLEPACETGIGWGDVVGEAPPAGWRIARGLPRWAGVAILSGTKSFPPQTAGQVGAILRGLVPEFTATIILGGALGTVGLHPDSVVWVGDTSLATIHGAAAINRLASPAASQTVVLVKNGGLGRKQALGAFSDAAPHTPVQVWDFPRRILPTWQRFGVVAPLPKPARQAASKLLDEITSSISGHLGGIYD